jgi:NAD(P)-dependent dehydrogenase (short-subunit alcohol dehydrogenase family)
MTSWSERNWLITGASSGFGLALAEKVLGRGGRVAAASRNPAALASLAAEHGERLFPVRLDVGDPTSVMAGLAEVEQCFGPVNVLVNNAGHGLIGSVEETGEAEYRALMEVNFFGAVAVIKGLLPGMRARRSGAIINFSSVSGITGPPGSGFYAASKFALEGLSDSLRNECRPLGIHVMVVEPGPFRTGFFGVERKLAQTRIADYLSVEKRRTSLHEQPGRQPGDPARGSDVILDALDSGDPPERLALGAMAVDIIGATYDKRRQELDRWAEQSRRADLRGDADGGQP